MNNYQYSKFDNNSSIATKNNILKHNKVLKNTYLLLAISLIPTVLGSMFGILSGINYGMLSNPGLSTLIFFIGSFFLMSCIEKNKNNSTGILFLLLFTFFMGIMLSRLLGIVIGMHNGSKIVTMAFGGTATIFCFMNFIAHTVKRDLSSLERFMTIGAVVLLLSIIANIFLQMSAMTLTICMLSMIVFSSFMLIDIHRIINNGETNYISATLALYLDIYNVFSNLLVIIGFFNNNKE
ncbi:Bax inhibitor-1 family protein [Candidatus Kinetoplastidibacterium crithidiae]|uniref:YccA-like protein n=1 Tax=Candidatus Kinetoplastidibacterium crithidiae TCC036E TaxID=1208918 RepID=M1LUG8_9PROT|nr:Bax inhibitor-1 family protein [Candidatus Kinetoplastibacterium crithidii]AFZ82602.1 inner membrane protein YccA [Candidatus Kinetoplastibacterium crithidii (ex Angomonas deanei ATCC 30255)]AGF47736.1 YccA-like protein [Candidatus Kinetoplastibacterium crithidii TCC036E]